MIAYSVLTQDGKAGTVYTYVSVLVRLKERRTLMTARKRTTRGRKGRDDDDG